MASEEAIPPLVGATEAARILGVPAPHLARLRAQGRMPEPVPVTGGNSVYRLEDVQALAEELLSEREAKKAAKAAK